MMNLKIPLREMTHEVSVADFPNFSYSAWYIRGLDRPIPPTIMKPINTPLKARLTDKIYVVNIALNEIGQHGLYDANNNVSSLVNFHSFEIVFFFNFVPCPTDRVSFFILIELQNGFKRNLINLGKQLHFIISFTADNKSYQR